MGWKAIKDHYRIGHIVQLRDSAICIGSGYISDLIKISLEGAVEKRYDRERGWSVNEDLARYQSEMDADPAKLRALAMAPDTFSVSTPVFSYEGGTILELQCEEPGWPNVTHDGRLMYENTFSVDRAQVVRWALRNARAAIECADEHVERCRTDLAEAEARLARHRGELQALLDAEGEPAP